MKINWYWMIGIILVLIIIGVIVSLIPNESPSLHTSPDTLCIKDDDCWCRIFTGAEFLEGKSPSWCCTEDVVQKKLLNQSGDWVSAFYCPNINHCSKCIYK